MHRHVLDTQWIFVDWMYECWMMKDGEGKRFLFNSFCFGTSSLLHFSVTTMSSSIHWREWVLEFCGNVNCHCMFGLKLHALQKLQNVLKSGGDLRRFGKMINPVSFMENYVRGQETHAKEIKWELLNLKWARLRVGQLGQGQWKGEEGPQTWIRCSDLGQSIIASDSLET